MTELSSLIHDPTDGIKKETATVFRCAQQYPSPRELFVEKYGASVEWTTSLFEAGSIDVVDEAQSNLQYRFSVDGDGRYSDGSISVVYGGACEDVALAEVAYHQLNLVPKRKGTTLRSGFYVYSIEVDGGFIDYTVCLSHNRELVGPYDFNEEKGRTFHPLCVDVARSSIDSGAAFLKVPSARKFSGVCVPLFDVSSINKGSISEVMSTAFLLDPSSSNVQMIGDNEKKEISVDAVYDEFKCKFCHSFIALE